MAGAAVAVLVIGASFVVTVGTMKARQRRVRFGRAARDAVSVQ